MIAGCNNPRIKAAVMQAPFPSGTLDCLNYPAGLLDATWREREEMTRARKASPTYAKVFRDWQEDRDGDDVTVFIKGVAAYHLMQGNKALAAAASTSWENQLTAFKVSTFATT
jgi:hypothetical protein